MAEKKNELGNPIKHPLRGSLNIHVGNTMMFLKDVGLFYEMWVFDNIVLFFIF